MLRFDNIIQGSPEWHEIKWGKIGGTLSKGLFVKSDTILIDILSQRSEEFEFEEDGFQNTAMQRGNDLEPFARQYLCDYTGIQFNQTGWLQSEENELLGISPDGISDCEKYSCEIKCFERKAHHTVLFHNEIPLDNLAQCLHYFTVNPKLEKHYFLCFRPEANKHFIRELTRKTVIDLGQTYKEEVKQFGVKGQEIKPKIITNSLLLEIDSWVVKSKNSADTLLTQIKLIELANKNNF
jgi:hypothetical protein